MTKPKLLRITTVPISLNILLKGQLRFLSEHFEVVGVSGAGTELDEVHEREGVPTIAVEMQRQISPFRDLVSLWQLYRLFRKEKPQIIHSITPKAGLLSMLAGKLAGVPIRMHTFTGLIFPYKTGLLQKILILMDRLLCTCATNIYPEGEGVKKDLQQYQITQKPLKIIGNGNVNGIDMAYFDPQLFLEESKNQLKMELNISNDDFVFVFVGRLVRDKGINELVKAFQQLQVPNIKLLLVGPLEQDLDPISPKTILQIVNNPHIISVGFQSDIRSYLSISDVLVFPSYREGFPNVVLQAGAMGLSCIVSDISGCNEIIIPNENGFIIPPKTSEILQNTMLEILQNKELHLSLQKNAREKIQTRYAQEYLWAALLEEYENLIINLPIRKFEN